MSTEINAEATRLRIQQLVEEIAALSRREMGSSDFFSQFLPRVVAATEARGGAVWLVATRGTDQKTEFQLAADRNFDDTLFQTNEDQRRDIQRALTAVSKNKRPMVLFPSGPEAEASP